MFLPFRTSLKAYPSDGLTIMQKSRENVSKTTSTLDSLAVSVKMVSPNASTSTLGLVSSPTIAMGALWQTVIRALLSKGRYRIWLCILVLILLLASSVLVVGSRSSHNEGMQYQQTFSVHPVDTLVQQGQRQFSTLLSKQSRTIEEARTEYARRYGRQPPPKFDVWFELAMQHNLMLVDEFDGAMRSLEPFWGVATSTLRTLTDNALVQLPDRLIRYEVINHQVSATQGSELPWLRQAIAEWLPSEWRNLVPNVTLAINVLDEPSVCVPHDVLSQALDRAHSGHDSGISTSQVSKHISRASPRSLDIGKQDVWEAVTLSCPVRSSARKPVCGAKAEGKSLNFINNLTESQDIVNTASFNTWRVSFLSLRHSSSPIRLRQSGLKARSRPLATLSSPVPYYTARSNDYIDAQDPDWEAKDNQLYWVGAATGGHATEVNWGRMQRQRMALMTATSSIERISLLDQADSGLWTPYTTNMSTVPYFSTRIMGVTPQCEPAACEAEKAAFSIGQDEIKDAPNAAFAHKFVLDLDGNSFSGRYYRLLQSKSLVLKQTLFEEWHDDRVFPWVHFVPVSTGFEELPELMRFLATTERGGEIAAQIAADSRVWASKVLRNVDMQLVWLRMLLEYGRMLDPERDA